MANVQIGKVIVRGWHRSPRTGNRWIFIIRADGNEKEPRTDDIDREFVLRSFDYDTAFLRKNFPDAKNNTWCEHRAAAALIAAAISAGEIQPETLGLVRRVKWFLTDILEPSQ